MKVSLRCIVIFHRCAYIVGLKMEINYIYKKHFLLASKHYKNIVSNS